MRVFLTGGTGTIGRQLIPLLVARGDQVVVLSREPRPSWLSRQVTFLQGNPCYQGDWQQAMAGYDAVINLAGEPMDGQRWNAQFRQKIHDSRTDSTRFVAEGICNLDSHLRPGVLINASSIEYYGFSEVEMFDDDEIGEEDPGGESYLSGLCWDWEDETKICSESGIRVVLMRIGLVLGDPSSLPALAAPFLRKLGGPLGTGRQYMSWIHILDVARGFIHALDSNLRGPVNLVAPGNLRNREFAQILGRILGRRCWLRAPARVVMARVGQRGEYLLKGRRTVPAALLADDYEFIYPEVEAGLLDLLRPSKRPSVRARRYSETAPGR